MGELEQEVIDFIEFLIEKKKKKIKDRDFKFDWEGGLEDLKDKYASVELQHKILEWWAED